MSWHLVKDEESYQRSDELEVLFIPLLVVSIC